MRRLSAEGLFAASERPEWMTITRCAPSAIAQPPALVVPIYDITVETESPAGALKRFARNVNRCFVARIDQTYLHDALFPQLIRRSFGGTAAGECDFAVVSRNLPQVALYGAPMRTDLLVRADLMTKAQCTLPLTLAASS